MSSAVTIHRDESPGRDRRCWPRESFQQVVLIFFGENNWGKLIDLSENGMSFEFDQAPPLRQRTDFKFVAISCVASHVGDQQADDSFGLAGEAVWTRQFERTAGVRFMDLPEMGRERIRNLLYPETTRSAGTLDEADNSEVLVAACEPTAFPVCPTEALREGGHEGTSDEPETAGSYALLGQRLDPEQIQKILEAPDFEAYKKLRIDEPARNLDSQSSKSRVVRIGLIVVFVLLAILSGVAVATRTPARWVRRALAAEQVPSLPADQGQPGSPKTLSAGLTPQPFMVEVSDLNNKTWLLWFDHTLLEPTARRSAGLSSPSQPKKKATSREQPSAAERHDRLQDGKYFRPQLSRPKTSPPETHLSADATPVIPPIPTSPTLESASGMLAPGEVPTPAVWSASAGGKVQSARLLKSVSPKYPALARSINVAGDVTLDALIDAEGNVRNVRAVSGPVLLEQAAMDAVRQWKYEPARLDGRPAAMHLSVTVKFSSR